jgi:RIO-like serine/threonine protein kinase
MPPRFTRRDFEAHTTALLSRGRFNNATVSLCRIQGEDWVVKDFRPKSRLVRWTTGRFFMARELQALQRLHGLPGIPGDAFRIDADAIAYRHLPGRTLPRYPRHLIPKDFFPRLEQLVQAMHERGVAHLDLRYRQNTLVLDDGSPGVIDFASFVRLDGLPAWLQHHFRRVDMSGVYKQWSKRAPDSLDEARRAMLNKQNRWRRLWVLKGYPFMARKQEATPPAPTPPTNEKTHA